MPSKKQKATETLSEFGEIEIVLGEGVTIAEACR